MPTYAYIPRALADRDSGSLEASRGVIQQLAGKLGLQIDREFVEAPGDAYVDRQNGRFGIAKLEDRPVGRQVLAALQSGDALIVDNPMVKQNQFALLILELAKMGVELHIASFELRGLPGGPLLAKALSFLLALDSRFASRRTQDGMLVAKLEGRSRGGRPAPGWKHVGPPGGRRRTPNRDEREVLMCIVRMRLSGWGWRRISSFLTAERVVWKKANASAPRGYSLEFWDPRRCERGYHSMLEVLAKELAAKRASTPKSA